MDYIRECYRVPAKVGGRVIAQGKPGTIKGAEGAHLLIQLDDGKLPLPYHPTWKIEYLSAGDPAASDGTAPVKGAGLRWTPHGRDQHAVTINGRHFFACRCKASDGWLIEEIDKPLGTGARVVRVIEDHVPTADRFAALAVYLATVKS